MNKAKSKYYSTALLMDEALLSLLETKEYEFITVKEICQRAGVNRSTFYLHYECIDDLLFEAIEMVNKRFNNAFSNEILDVSNLDKKDLFLINDKYLIPYLNFIKENKKIYKLIHANPFIFKSNIVFNELYNKIFTVILDKYGVIEKEKEYIFAYFSYGLVAIIQKWIDNDCNDEISMIAELMKRVIRYNND